MIWSLIDAIVPGAMYFKDRQAEGWLKSLQPSLEERIEELAATVSGLPKESLAHLEKSLQDEHQRLNGIEQKARITLGAVGVIIPLTLLIARAPASSYPRMFALAAILYLALGMLQAIRANSIGVRWYVGANEYKAALDKHSKSDDDRHAIVVAHLLAARDRMAYTNQFKVNATDAALRSLRNGLLVLAAAAIWTLVETWFAV